MQEAIKDCDWALENSTENGLREMALMLRGDANTELRRWEVRDASLPYQA